MIVGIGTDIVEVERMQEKMLKNNGFIELVFSELERAYCLKQKFPAQHFAARFAAKESFLKATAKGMLLNLPLSKIEIQNNADGLPTFIFDNDAQEIISHQIGSSHWQTHLSLSHTQTTACAFVIIDTVK